MTYTFQKILLFAFTIILFGCNRPDLSAYIDVNDDNSNLLYKFNPKDCTAVIFPTGNIYLMGKLIDSKKEGVWSEYIIDDNYKAFERTYKNGIENGKWFAFTSTGKVKFVGGYKNGSHHGAFVYFDLEGKPEKIEMYKAVENHKGISDFIYSKDLRKK